MPTTYQPQANPKRDAARQKNNPGTKKEKKGARPAARVPKKNELLQGISWGALKHPFTH
jgi:hypothetical protein